MITEWLDLGGVLVLFVGGLYHLRRGAAQVERHGGGRWHSALEARLTMVLGGSVFAMGLWLLLYSVAFALISAGTLNR